MRHVVSGSVIAMVAVLASAPAFADPGAVDPADPRFAPEPQSVPESAPVESRLPLTGPFAGSEAWLVAGPCEAPCAPPPPPAPCGVCRQGFDACGNPKWGGEISIGGWIPGLNGSLGVRGRSTDVSTTPADALDYLSDLDFTILAGVRATYGRWNFRAGFYYLGMGTEVHVSDERGVDVSFEQWLVEGAVGYRAWEVPLGCEPCAPCMAVQPFVGVRYNSLDQKIRDRAVTAPLPSVSENKSWADLIVGVELMFDFRNHWWGRFEADVGGFGLTGDSDMTWGARGEIGYRFNEHVGTFVGIGAIDWDYQDGGFTWNLTEWGPYLGFAFWF